MAEVTPKLLKSDKIEVLAYLQSIVGRLVQGVPHACKQLHPQHATISIRLPDPTMLPNC
jgi:hypothetical protein